MIKTININGVPTVFKTSGATPMLYKLKFKSDFFSDVMSLQGAFSKKNKGVDFTSMDLNVFFNIAYIAAKQADQSIPDEPLEWLDKFEMFDIMKILPEMMDLITAEMQTAAESKKKLEKVIGN